MKKTIKTKFHVGDTVRIISGDDKGRSGKILKLDLANEKVTVEGVNERVRHRRAANGQEGGRISITKPVHISNVVAEKKQKKKSTTKKKTDTTKKTTK